MAAIACELFEPSGPRSNAKPTPFEPALVTLTKQVHIELVTQANDWRWAHRRALARFEGQAAH